jgi:hypothetical protein
MLIEEAVFFSGMHGMGMHCQDPQFDSGQPKTEIPLG